MYDVIASKSHDHWDYLLGFFVFLFWLFSTVNKDGFKPNLETHLIPLLSTKLEETSLESKEKSTASSSKPSHHPLLMQVSNSFFQQLVSKSMHACLCWSANWELSILFLLKTRMFTPYHFKVSECFQYCFQKKFDWKFV